MNKSQLIAEINTFEAAPKGLRKMPKAELIKLLAVIKHEAQPAPEPEVVVEPELEVEPELSPAEKAQQRFQRASASMTGTMRIADRRIVQLSEAGEALVEFKNSNRAYKAGALTASQGDRVTKVLMDAIKTGGVGEVEVNGFRWVLSQHFEEGLFGPIEAA